MNRGELKAAVKRYGFDDTDPLDVWINAARNEVVTDAKLPTRDELTSISSNSGVADLKPVLPSDYFKMITLQDITDTSVVDLNYMEWREFRRTIRTPDQTGRPQIFSLRGLDHPIIWPVPDRNTSWSLNYQRTVTQMDNDVDSPDEVDAQFHYTIVFRAAAIGLMAENEEERAQTAMAEYASGIEKIAEAYGTMQLGRFNAVQDSMGYGDL